VRLPESLSRLLHTGVDPELSAEATRHIVVVNAGALLGVVSTAPFIFVGLWLQSPVMAGLNAVHPFLWFFSIWLNSRGKHWHAAMWLLGAVTLEFAIQPLLWGPDSGAQYALLLPAMVAWSLFDFRHTRWAALMSLIATVLFLIHLNLEPQIRQMLDGFYGPDTTIYGPIAWARMGLDPFLVYGMNVGTVALFVAGFSYILRLQIMTVDNRLRRARDRSETLLLNVFPGPIVGRLKREEDIADQYESMSVLFADIVGFTPFSSSRSPAEVLEVLGSLFSRYDELAESHGVEKVKTIGDAYMAVAGAPIPCDDHAQRVAGLALDMVSETRRLADELGEPLLLRIGLNSGPAVAGVIGQQRFCWDIWGDTVNVAARMESHGEGGRVQVSDATRILLDGHFKTESRGEIEVKGKGLMQTHWLIR